MATYYRVIFAATEGGVIQAAQRDGWALVSDIHAFAGLDSGQDGSIRPAPRRLMVDRSGYCALGRKEGEA